MSIEAKYADTCEACEGPIHPGQQIDRDSFTERWMHTECPQDKERPVCEVCWMQKAANGACGCESEGKA